MSLYRFSKDINNAIEIYNEKIESLVYADGNLTINNNETLTIQETEYYLGEMIINTSDLSQDEIDKYKEDVSKSSNKIVLLKNKLIMKNEMLSNVIDVSYSDILSEYNINNIDKQEIIDMLNANKTQVYTYIFIVVFISLFSADLFSIIIDVLALAVIAYVFAKLVHLPMKFSQTFSMGAPSITLPILLNIIYIIVNILTGYTIKYFSIMYTAISYIYIITAIFIIKSDYIKKNGEVENIKTIQEQIREEMEAKQQEEEERKQKEKEDKEKKERKDKEGKEENNKLPDINNKPEGSNV